MSMRINDIYRSTEVQRWHIVKTKRKQSVAEHSFIVTIIAQHICQAIGLTPKQMFEVTQYAMYHDIAECIFGDIPSPAKVLTDYNNQIEPHERHVLGKYHLPDASDLTKIIVKLADVTESVKFLLLNRDSPHSETVYQQEYARLQKVFKKFLEQLIIGVDSKPTIKLRIEEAEGLVWECVIQQFLHGEEYTIDDYMRELQA